MLEVRRKLMHIFSGIAIIVLLKLEILNLISCLIILTVGIILAGLSRQRPVPVIHWFLKQFDRPDTDPPGKGALTYMISICILLILFQNLDMDIVYAAIIILALGDAFASLIGTRLKSMRYLPKTPLPLSAEKVLEGTVVGFVVASLGAMLFVSVLEAVLASLVAMLIEGIDLRYGEESVDDNLLIPLSAAIVIYVIRYFWLIG